MSTTTTTNYLGKCREEGCEYVIFATAEDVQPADTFRDVTAGTGVYRVGNNGLFSRCTNRHKVFPCKAVKGTYSEAHKCDARCLNAKGWECTCSCGGANHGRGHVAAVVKASDLPPAEPVYCDRYERQVREPGLLDMVAQAVVRENPELAAPELRHLGTPGEHITGQVFVKSFKSLANGSVLYTFRAVNGGHVIKWFCPGHADPGFEVGSTIKIRAKVKRHDEFQGTPETLVTYVEAVE